MLASAQSRLKSDFEVIGIIGRGGFGHVFKVENEETNCRLIYNRLLII